MVSTMAMTDGGDDWRARVEAAVAAHRAKYAGWQNRSMPPRLSLRELNLPEPVLVACLTDKTCPGDQRAYLDALAARGTETSARAVYAWASSQPYPSTAWWQLAEGGPQETVLELQRKDVSQGTQSLAYALALVRRARLPEAERKRLYEQLRAQVARPANGDPEDLWKALHALDPARARDELAGFLGDGGENLYVLRLLALEPRPERPLVRKALLAHVEHAETMGWLGYATTLLWNLGDDAVPPLKQWAERALKARHPEQLDPLITQLQLYPRSPAVDAFKAALARDVRLSAGARAALARNLQESGAPGQ